MTDVRLDVRADAHIGTITLQRAAKANAFTIAMVAQFLDALGTLERDDAIKVIVVRGDGGDLSVGLDVNEAEAIYRRSPSQRRVPSQRARFSAHHDLWWGPQGLFHRVLHSPKITIVEARGRCLGIGLYLSLCADLVICDEQATFGNPRWRHVGVDGDISMLVAAVGLKRAGELMYCGYTWTAREAVAYGLVDSAVAAGQLETAVTTLAGSCAMIMRDGIAAEKQVVLAALQRMQIGTGFAAAAVLGGWASNIHHREGEFNFLREMRDHGASQAMARSNQHFAPGPHHHEATDESNS